MAQFVFLPHLHFIQAASFILRVSRTICSVLFGLSDIFVLALQKQYHIHVFQYSIAIRPQVMIYNLEGLYYKLQYLISLWCETVD